MCCPHYADSGTDVNSNSVILSFQLLIGTLWFGLELESIS